MKKVIIGLVILMVMLLRSLSLAEEKGVGVITLEQAVEIAKKEVPGKVIEAESEKGVYEIKIRTGSGEIVKLKIGHRDGDIIRKGRIIKGASKNFGKPEQGRENHEDGR